MARFQAHSSTSRAAARHTARRREKQDRERILAFYKKQGDYGATSDEVQRMLKLLHQTGSARVADLLQEGKLIESGRRRRTRHGRWADVLILAPPGTAPRVPRQRHQLEGFTHAHIARLIVEIDAVEAFFTRELQELPPELRRLRGWLRSKRS